MSAKKSRLPWLVPLTPDEIERRRADAIRRQHAKAAEPSPPRKTSTRKPTRTRKRTPPAPYREPKPASGQVRAPRGFTEDPRISALVIEAVGRLDEPGPYAVKQYVCSRIRCGAGTAYDHLNDLITRGRVLKGRKNLLSLPKGE